MPTTPNLIREIAELLMPGSVKGHSISEGSEELDPFQWLRRQITLRKILYALKDWRRIRRTKGRMSTSQMIYAISRKFDLPPGGWSSKETISALYDVLIRGEK